MRGRHWQGLLWWWRCDDCDGFEASVVPISLLSLPLSEGCGVIRFRPRGWAVSDAICSVGSKSSACRASDTIYRPCRTVACWGPLAVLVAVEIARDVGDSLTIVSSRCVRVQHFAPPVFLLA